MKSQTNTTPKQFNQKYKRGDLRKDGYLFWSYTSKTKKDGKRGECWLTKDAYHKCSVRSTVSNCQRRAKQYNIPFDIDVDYLLSIFPINNQCPVFGIDLEWGLENGHNNSPSLDRIHPALGYVKGNVIWTSMYANRLKSDHSLDTLRTLLAFYEKLERRNE